MKKDARREIMGLVLILEEVSDLTVFVDYSGHVKCLTVRVYESYEEGKEIELLRERFYVSFDCGTEKNYLAIKEFLQSKIEEYTAI